MAMRANSLTAENKRRTLQRNDIAMAVSKTDTYDFLIDIVPREEVSARPVPHGSCAETARRIRASCPEGWRRGVLRRSCFLLEVGWIACGVECPVADCGASTTCVPAPSVNVGRGGVLTRVSQYGDVDGTPGSDRHGFPNHSRRDTRLRAGVTALERPDCPWAASGLGPRWMQARGSYRLDGLGGANHVSVVHPLPLAPGRRAGLGRRLSSEASEPGACREAHGRDSPFAMP